MHNVPCSALHRVGPTKGTRLAIKGPAAAADDGLVLGAIFLRICPLGCLLIDTHDSIHSQLLSAGHCQQDLPAMSHGKSAQG